MLQVVLDTLFLPREGVKATLLSLGFLASPPVMVCIFQTAQETSGHQSAEKSLPVISQESISYKSSSAPGATSTSQRSFILLSESLGQRVSSQGEGSHSALSLGASSRYTPGSLMSNKLYALPIGVSSQSTSAQRSSSGSPSTQSRFGTQLATSSHYDSVQGGSSSSFSHKPQRSPPPPEHH